MRSRLLSGAATPILGRAAGGGALPVGAVQWLAANPGAGSLPCTGLRFSAAAYPELAKKLPLLPGSPEVGTLPVTDAMNAIAQAKSGPYAGRIIIAGNTGTLYYNDNPTGAGAWTSFGANPWGNLAIASSYLCWGPAGFLLTTGGSSGNVYLSQDGGVSWSQVLSTNRVIYNVQYNEILGLYIASGNLSTIWTSATGLSFTNKVAEIASTDPINQVMILPSGAMIAVAPKRYIYSDTSNNWTVTGNDSFYTTIPDGRAAVFGSNMFSFSQGNGVLWVCSANPGSKWYEYRPAGSVWGDGATTRTGGLGLFTIGKYLFASVSSTKELFYNTDANLNPDSWVKMKGTSVTSLSGMSEGLERQMLLAGTGGLAVRVPLRSTPILAPAYADDGTTLLTPYVKAA